MPKPGEFYIAKPHDTIAKRMVQNREIAQDVFQQGLPEELVACVDWATIDQSSEQFINQEFGQRFGDGVFRATCRGRSILLALLLQHQSSGDHWMPYRFHENTLLFWGRSLASEPKRTTVPMVIPMVLSNSEYSWTAPTSMRGLVEGIDLYPQCALDVLPVRSYFVFDLHKMTNAELVGLGTSAVRVCSCWRCAMCAMRGLRSWYSSGRGCGRLRRMILVGCRSSRCCYLT